MDSNVFKKTENSVSKKTTSRSTFLSKIRHIVEKDPAEIPSEAEIIQKELVFDQDPNEQKNHNFDENSIRKLQESQGKMDLTDYVSKFRTRVRFFAKKQKFCIFVIWVILGISNLPNCQN